MSFQIQPQYFNRGFIHYLKRRIQIEIVVKHVPMTIRLGLRSHTAQGAKGIEKGHGVGGGDTHVTLQGKQNFRRENLHKLL